MMEAWQQNHIRKNLPELLKHTLCSSVLFAQLQSAELLTDEEKEIIACQPTNCEKADTLYQLLGNKTNGYVGLVRAFNKLQLTGALKILLEGYPIDNIARKKVSFLGKTQSLSELLNHDQLENVVASLQKSLEIEEYLQFIENQETEFDLTKKTVPEPKPFYISRFLTGKIGLDPSVFKTNARDVFVLQRQGDCNMLYSFLPDATIAESYMQMKEITSRFIVLDVDDDWNQLRLKADKPIHLIKYDPDSANFVIVETSGGSQIIHQCLTAAQQERILEHEIFDTPEVLDSNGACISDSPGMGKSWLLGNLAWYRASNCSSSVVALINLSEVAVMLPKDNTSLSHELVIKTVMQLLTSSKLGAAVLERILIANPQQIKLELFLDALDEVRPDYMDRITTFLKYLLTLKEMPITKLYMTSRKHVRGELEKALGVLAYDIEPFSTQNQIDFLKGFFKLEKSNIDITKLEEFVETTVRTINAKLTRKEKCVAGVPLLCRLIGEVLSVDASIYAHPKRKKTEITLNSLHDLYSEYFFQKLGKSVCNLHCIYKSNERKAVCSKMCRLLNYHVGLAIKEIFPDFCLTFLKFLRWDIVSDNTESNIANDDRQTILRTGIIECSGEKLELAKFSHRTFAEYLLAYFLEHTFTYGIRYTEIPDSTWQLFYKNVFLHTGEESNFNFQLDVVMFFLESNLQKQNKDKKLIPKFYFAMIPLSQQSFSYMLLRCYVNKYSNLLQLVLDLVKEFSSFTKLVYSKLQTSDCLKDTEDLFLRVIASNVCPKMVPKFLKSMEEWFEIDFNEKISLRMNLCKGNDASTEHVEIAIASSNLEAVKFFLERPHIPDHLLICAAANTYFMDSANLEKRLEIAHFLLRKHSNFKDTKECSTSLYPKVHFQMIKLLLDNNIFDLRSVSANESIVHSTVAYMNARDFLELSGYLIFDKKSPYLFFDDPKYRNNPLVCIAVQKQLGMKTTIAVLKQLANACTPTKLSKEVSKLFDKQVLARLCPFSSDTINFDLLVFYAELERLSSWETTFLGGLGGCDTATKMPNLYEILELFMVNTVLNNKGSRTNLLHCLARHKNIGYFHTVLTQLEKNWNRILEQANQIKDQEPDLYNKLGFRKITPPEMPQNFEDYINYCDSHGRTTLYYYVYNFPSLENENLDWFLMGGRSTVWNENLVCVDINKFGPSCGDPPIFAAVCRQQKLSFLDHMISRGAKFRVRGSFQENLVLSCVKGFPYLSYEDYVCKRPISTNSYTFKVIEKFLNLGIDVNEFDDFGNNILQCYFQRQYKSSLKKISVRTKRGSQCVNE